MVEDIIMPGQIYTLWGLGDCASVQMILADEAVREHAQLVKKVPYWLNAENNQKDAELDAENDQEDAKLFRALTIIR